MALMSTTFWRSASSPIIRSKSAGLMTPLVPSWTMTIWPSAGVLRGAWISSTPAENWRLSVASTVVTCGTSACARDRVDGGDELVGRAEHHRVADGGDRGRRGTRRERSSSWRSAAGVVVHLAGHGRGRRRPGRARRAVCAPNPAGAAALPPLPRPMTMITRPTTSPAATEREAGHQLCVGSRPARSCSAPTGVRARRDGSAPRCTGTTRAATTNVSARRSTSSGRPVSGMSECGRVTM